MASFCNALDQTMVLSSSEFLWCTCEACTKKWTWEVGLDIILFFFFFFPFKIYSLIPQSLASKLCFLKVVVGFEDSDKGI